VKRRHPNRSHGEVQGTVRSNEHKQIGTIGDVNFPEYDGGPVYDRGDGTYYMEYVEIPSDDLDFGDPNARWTVYGVELDPGVPSWGSLKDVARTVGADPKELKAAFESDDPMARAGAYMDWAGHYGWHEFDSYPLTLTCAETAKRYDTDLGCFNKIHEAIEEIVQEESMRRRPTMAARRRIPAPPPPPPPPPEPARVRKPIADMIEELRSWIPNYDRGEKEFPTLLFRVIASLPGGDRLEDMGYETFNLGWQEADMLGRTLEAIQDTRDVEDLVNGLMDEEEEGAGEARRAHANAPLDRNAQPMRRNVATPPRRRSRKR